MSSNKTIPGELLKVGWHLVNQASFDDDVEPHQRGTAVPLPTEELRLQSSTGNLGLYYAIGEAYAQIAQEYLPPAPTVLDIGCSRGRLARFLCLNPSLTYIGFDIHADSIDWANRYFPRMTGDRATFVHADLKSATFNAVGSSEKKISEYRFPAENGSVDMAVASSLFTHLYEEDCVHYLRETSRVLRPGGAALLSIHIDVPTGVKYCGEPQRIDVDPVYFIGLAEAAGLTPVKIVGNVYGQHLILFAKQ